MTESRSNTAAEQLPEGVEEYEDLRNRKDLDRFLGKHGISSKTPKHIMYAFKRNLGQLQWEDRATRYFSEPCPVGEILERIADIDAFTGDEPSNFTVGLVLRDREGKQVAIRYKMEESEVEVSKPLPEDAERELDQVVSYEVAVCQDHRVLEWEGRSLISF